jgi:hypothetical protein
MSAVPSPATSLAGAVDELSLAMVISLAILKQSILSEYFMCLAPFYELGAKHCAYKRIIAQERRGKNEGKTKK